MTRHDKQSLETRHLDAPFEACAELEPAERTGSSNVSSTDNIHLAFTQERPSYNWTWVAFLKPNPTQNFSPNPRKFRPESTQPISDTRQKGTYRTKTRYFLLQFVCVWSGTYD